MDVWAPGNTSTLCSRLFKVINAFVAYRGWVPRNMGRGLELLNPNPSSQNTQEPALLATQPRAPPARKRPCPNPGPSTRHTELEEQWRTYIKDYKK